MPVRCCMACKKRKEKNELIRIVSKNNKAVIDYSQKENTRGMYICKDKNCISSMIKAINKNKLKTKIKIEQDSLLELLKELGEEIWVK